MKTSKHRGQSSVGMTAMPVRPPFRYCSQAVAYVSITPFVGVINRSAGDQRWFDWREGTPKMRHFFSI
jgi:hypothetical protein